MKYVLLFLSMLCLYIIPSHADSFSEAAFKHYYHYGFTHEMGKICKKLKINRKPMDDLELKAYPFLYGENDNRWTTFEAFKKRGRGDGKLAKVRFIKQNSLQKYCEKLLSDYGPQGRIVANYIIENVKSMEEKSGLPNQNLVGCGSVQETVFFGSPCNPDPRANPKSCKRDKVTYKKLGRCRDDLKVLTHSLTKTGDEHKEVWHQEFSGLKKSGPFLRIKDKDGKLWWVNASSWEIAITPKGE